MSIVPCPVEGGPKEYPIQVEDWLAWFLIFYDRFYEVGPILDNI